MSRMMMCDDGGWWEGRGRELREWREWMDRMEPFAKFAASNSNEQTNTNNDDTRCVYKGDTNYRIWQIQRRRRSRKSKYGKEEFPRKNDMLGRTLLTKWLINYNRCMRTSYKGGHYTWQICAYSQVSNDFIVFFQRCRPIGGKTTEFFPHLFLASFALMAHLLWSCTEKNAIPEN